MNSTNSFIFGLIALAAPGVLTTFYFRRFALSGVTFTPFMVSLGLLWVVIAPPMLFASHLNLYPGWFTILFFYVVFFSLWTGFMFGGRARFALLITRGSGYIRAIEKKTERQHDVAVIALFMLLTITGLVYFGGVPLSFHSLIATLTGDVGAYTKQFQLERLALTKGAYFGGEYKGQGVHNALQEIGWSLIIAHASANVASKRNAKAITWLFITFLGAWLFVAGNGTRGPLLLCLVGGMVAYSQIRPIPLRSVSLFAMFAMGLLIFLTSYTHRFEDIASGEASWIDALQRVFDRLTLEGNGKADVEALLASDKGRINEGVGHFHLRDLVSAIPGVQGGMPLAAYLTDIYGGGLTTFRTGTYVSKIYVDFGLAGAIALMTTIGFVLRVLQNSLQPTGSNPWTIAVISVVILYSSKLLMNGIYEFSAMIAVLTFVLSVHFTILNIVPSGRVQNRRGNKGRLEAQP